MYIKMVTVNIFLVNMYFLWNLKNIQNVCIYNLWPYNSILGNIA